MPAISHTPRGLADSGAGRTDATADALATDEMVVRDRAGRRRFIRNGAAFLLTGGATLVLRAAYSADCDRGGEGCEVPRCSDGDSGENSDPVGRGRRCAAVTISQRVPEVGKIRG